MRDEDRLGEWLRRADAAMGGAACDAARLAARSRAAARGRRRRRHAAGLFCGLAVAAAIGGIAMIRWRGRGARPVVVAPKAGTAGIANGATPHGAADDLDLFDPAWRARDEAAGTMVFMARQRAARVGKEETKKAYERVLALFPGSSWAQVARAEDTKLEKPN